MAATIATGATALCSEITPENASKLSPVWAMSTGGQFGGLEGDAPLPRRRPLLLRRLRPHLRRRREVRQHPLALRARIWRRVQRRAVLRPYPSRRGARGRSRHRRAARREAGRAEPRGRQSRLGRSDRRLEARRHDELRAARREGSRHHRRLGRRIWRSRLSEVLQRRRPANWNGRPTPFRRPESPAARPGQRTTAGRRAAARPG